MDSKEKELTEKLRQVFKVSQKVDHTGYPRSAVLVPLMWEKGELAVLFEVRSYDLAWQPGDICFPGGRIESRDATPMVTAVRETSEELGVSPNRIKVLGALNDIASNIGVMLYPFVGYISGGEPLKPNAKEVAEVFTVPLNFLLETEPLSASMEMATRPKADFPFDLLPNDYPQDWKVRTTYQVNFYSYKEHVIWGLTAKVLKDFLEGYRRELLSLEI